MPKSATVYSDPEQIKVAQENYEHFKSGILFARHRVEDIFVLCHMVECYCPERSITLRELENVLLEATDPEIIDKYFTNTLNLAVIEEANNGSIC